MSAMRSTLQKYVQNTLQYIILSRNVENYNTIFTYFPTADNDSCFNTFGSHQCLNLQCPDGFNMDTLR